MCGNNHNHNNSDDVDEALFYTAPTSSRKMDLKHFSSSNNNNKSISDF